MTNHPKYEQILDALQNLMESRSIQSISVSEIAQTAGMGKGSIYYYFPSKDAILDALIERNYEKPLETAKTLAGQTEISPFTRMAMIFQACRSSSSEFLRQEEKEPVSLTGAQEHAFIHQKYMAHLISELKPVLAEIIRQGIDSGEIHFPDPAALAEIGHALPRIALVAAEHHRLCRIHCKENRFAVQIELIAFDLEITETETLDARSVNIISVFEIQ